MPKLWGVYGKIIMRLIDADLLKERFPQTTYYEYQDNKNSNKRICKIIDDAPTIEQRLIGKWTYSEECETYIGADLEAEVIIPRKYRLPICSECGTEFGTMAFKYKYCPECGAKMEK